MEKLPKLPRMAAVHDLSGMGKCSLTVALPIVSATGVECCCIPTALLSTHTGGFAYDWTFTDLSGDIVPIAEHWHSLGLRFDAIYSGYLASEAQGELLERAIELLKNDETLVIVDPAMADNGKYYANLGDKMTECFRRLIKKADIITPNITEACFLTGMEYRPGTHSMAYVTELIDRLSELGPNFVAVTGVSAEPGKVGIVARDNKSGRLCSVMDRVYRRHLPRLGRCLCLGLCGTFDSRERNGGALNAAEKFVTAAIERTAKRNTPRHYGLDFEGVLPKYIKICSRLFE
ncbi:MAG: pyridoxamine kinase [Oscillospiraceae bacterium]